MICEGAAINGWAPRAAAVVAVILTACAPPFSALERDERIRASLWSLQGTVTGAESRAVVHMLRWRPDEGGYAVEDEVILPVGGRFEFIVVPSHVVLTAFADSDGDGRYDEGEASGWTRLTPQSTAAARRAVRIELANHDAAVTADGARLGQRIHFGTQVELSDPRFSREVANLSVWESVRFMAEFGAGAFVLEPIDPQRVPVVFVHGMGGTPREFRYLLSRLPVHFQPWLAHYPSGWELETVSRYVAQNLTVMRSRYGIDRVCVVAHSMGGLVYRRTLGMLAEQDAAPLVYGLVTLASPLGGQPAARLGVQLAPAVVPSWRSLTPGSPFMTAAWATPLRAHTRFALVFTYEDEVVGLAEQLPPQAQTEATLMRGFGLGHTAVLEDPSVAEFVLEELERCRQAPLAAASASEER